MILKNQMQLDWKESIPFTLSSREIIDVNIFVLISSEFCCMLYILAVMIFYGNRVSLTYSGQGLCAIIDMKELDKSEKKLEV